MNSIIIYHFLYHGGLLNAKYNTFSKYNIAWSLFCFNQWHVDAFGLISGIVGYKKFRYSNLIYLWFCVFFYSVSISSIYKFLYPKTITNEYFIKTFFPVITNQYWYFTSYFSAYLFFPILTKSFEIID